MQEKKIKNPEDLLELLDKKVFPVKLTGAPKRSISHWFDIGLIPNENQVFGKDRYLTYVEFFWVCLIIELREAGVPSDRVKKVKEYVENELDSIYIKGKLPRLKKAILTMIVNEAPLFLLVSNRGNVAIYDDEAMHFDLGSGFYDTYTVLRLNRIFKKKIKGIRFNTYFTDYLRLTPEEERVLHALYDKKTESIKVIKKKGEIEVIELEQNVVVDKKIIDILKEQKYQNIEIKQHNGKITKIKRTVKRRVRPDYKKKTSTNNKKNSETGDPERSNMAE